jgi:hypothetical protein
MKLKFAALAVVLSGLLVAGCGSEEKSSDEPNSALKNADDVEASQEAAAAQEVDLGKFGDLSDDTRVSVTAMKVGGDDLGPWLEVSIRFENAAKVDAAVPVTGIVCKGSAEPGENQAGSTLDSGDPVPAGSFKEGVLNLLVPGEGRTGEPVPVCDGPAFVQVTGEDPETSADKVVRVPVADEVLAQLQAAYRNAAQ